MEKLIDFLKPLFSLLLTAVMIYAAVYLFKNTEYFSIYSMPFLILCSVIIAMSFIAVLFGSIFDVKLFIKFFASYLACITLFSAINIFYWFRTTHSDTEYTRYIEIYASDHKSSTKVAKVKLRCKDIKYDLDYCEIVDTSS